MYENNGRMRMLPPESIALIFYETLCNKNTDCRESVDNANLLHSLGQDFIMHNLRQDGTKANHLFLAAKASIVMRFTFWTIWTHWHIFKEINNFLLSCCSCCFNFPSTNFPSTLSPHQVIKFPRLGRNMSNRACMMIAKDLESFFNIPLPT